MDTPSSFSGEGGKYVRVNSGETDLEFTDALIESVSGQPAPSGININDLGDVTITSPTTGQTLFYSGGQWINGAGGGGTPASPDRGIQFNNGGAFGAAANFVYSSVGHLGLGTATPQAQLDINGTGAVLLTRGNLAQRPSAPVNGMIRYNNQSNKFEGYQNGTWSDIITGSVISSFITLTDTPGSYSGEGGKYVRVNTGATALEFTDRLIPTVTGGAAPATTVLDDLGDVAITSPTAGQTLFYSGGQWINGAGGGGTPAGINTQIQFNNSGSFGASSNLTWNGTTFAVTGDITYSGTITDVSDRRLKTEITHLNDRGSMLEKIGMIDTYSFRMKTRPDDGVEFGVMAQDIQKIFPELVRTDKSTPENYLSVNYVGMIAPMIEATKELKAENDALKAELAEIRTDREAMATALNDLSRDVKGLKAHTGYGIDKAGFEFWMMIMVAAIIGASATLLVIGSMRQSRKRG